MAWQDAGTYKEGVGWTLPAQAQAAAEMDYWQKQYDKYNPKFAIENYGVDGNYGDENSRALYQSQLNDWNNFSTFDNSTEVGRAQQSEFDRNKADATTNLEYAKSQYSESQRKMTPEKGSMFTDPKFLAFAALATGGMALTGGFGAGAGSIGYGGAGAAGGAEAGAGAGYFGGISQGAGGITGLTSGAGGVTGLTGGAGTTLGSGSIEAAMAGLAGGSGVGFGGAGGSAGWLSDAKSLYNGYSNANKVYKGVDSLLNGGNSQGMLQNGSGMSRAGGGMGGNGGSTDWGSMFGGAGNALLSNYLSQRNVDNAGKLAGDVKFKPYSISSDLGRSYQDPRTGEMISQLSSPFQQQQQAMLGQVGSNLNAANADPMVASQDAYNKMKQLSSFQDQQQRTALEDRLQQQGMLGSTGGSTQMQAFQNSLNDKDVNMQLQSVGLGQQLTNNATSRAMQNWTGAMAPTAAMGQQVGMGGTFGNFAQTGQASAANLMNNANNTRLKAMQAGGSSLFGSPAMQGGINGLFGGGKGVQGMGGAGGWLNSIGQASNALGSAGNWLGGMFGGNSGNMPAYGVDQYASLLGQQDGFNWSGLDGVSAGSAQDMMLNNQWDGSW